MGPPNGSANGTDVEPCMPYAPRLRPGIAQIRTASQCRLPFSVCNLQYNLPPRPQATPTSRTKYHQDPFLVYVYQSPVKRLGTAKVPTARLRRVLRTPGPRNTFARPKYSSARHISHKSQRTTQTEENPKNSGRAPRPSVDITTTNKKTVSFLSDSVSSKQTGTKLDSNVGY